MFLGSPNPCRTQGVDCQSKVETSSEDSNPKKSQGGLKRNVRRARRHQQGPSQRDAGLDRQQQEAGLPPTRSPDPISRKACPRYHPGLLHTSYLPEGKYFSPEEENKAGAPAPSHHEQLLQAGESSQPEGLFQQDGVEARGLPGSLLIYHLQQTTAACFLLPASLQGHHPDTRAGPSSSPHQAVRISPIFGQNKVFLCLLSARAVKEGDLKACGTCAQQRGCERVCRRTELLIKTARSDAIERLVVTLC